MKKKKKTKKRHHFEMPCSSVGHGRMCYCEKKLHKNIAESIAILWTKTYCNTAGKTQENCIAMPFIIVKNYCNA